MGGDGSLGSGPLCPGRHVRRAPRQARLRQHFRLAPDRYHYALELPPRDPDDVYLPAGEGDDVTFEELLDEMIEHLDG